MDFLWDKLSISLGFLVNAVSCEPFASLQGTHVAYPPKIDIYIHTYILANSIK